MSTRIPKHKHELKEDKFISFVFRTVDYIKATWKTFAIVGFIIVAIIIIMAAYMNHRNKLNEIALQDYSTAINLYNKQNFAAAQDSLSALIENYKSTEYGKRAVLYMGKIALKNQNYENALEYFTEASKKIDNKLLKKAAMIGVAKYYQTQNETELYYKYLAKVAREYPNANDAPDLYLKVANYYKENDQIEAAKKIYNLITRKYKHSDVHQDAKTNLNKIKKEQLTL